MKGFVFTFNRKRSKTKAYKSAHEDLNDNSYEDKTTVSGNSMSSIIPKAIKSRDIDVKRYTEKYGLLVFLAAFLLFGVLYGSFTAKAADDQLLISLDFLFTTNLESRMTQSFMETFSSCFSSNFVFLLAVFLVGLSPWGMAVTPLIVAFKGFGIGLCAGYLYISFGFQGIGFYMLVLLTGLFIFSVAMLILSKHAISLSLKLMRQIFFDNSKLESYKKSGDAGKRTSFFHVSSARGLDGASCAQNDINNYSLKSDVKDYFFHGGQILILSAVAALTDTILWCSFAPLFNL